MDFALLGGLLLHFLLIQQGHGKLWYESDATDKDRTILCFACEPDVLNYPKCPDKLNPKQLLENLLIIDRCYQCFIEHIWYEGKYAGERRGCFAGNVVEPGGCTYIYPVDGDFGNYGDMREVHEICRCRKSACNNVTILNLGGKGDISKFPETTTFRAQSGAQGRGEYYKDWVQFWGLLVGLAGIIYANLI